MGKKKTTTEQTNRPVYEAEISRAANSQQAAYDAQAPRIAEYSNGLMDLSGDLLSQYRQGDPTVQAAQGFLTDTLSTDPQNNPYLDDMVSLTNDNTRRAIQTQLGTRGGIGGSSERDIVSRALSEQELGMRYADYDNQQNRRMQAAGLTPSVTSSQYIPLAAAMEAGQTGAMLPLQASLANSAGVGGLLGQYQNQTGTQTQNSGFMGVLGAGLQGASLFSDERLKTDIKRVGQTDQGTPIYTYRYLGEGPYHMGVMADDVPHAQGPVIQGFKTVKYEEVA